MIIKFDEDQAKSIAYVLKKRVERIAFPGKFRVFWEDSVLVIEIFDETLVEFDKYVIPQSESGN